VGPEYQKNKRTRVGGIAHTPHRPLLRMTTKRQQQDKAKQKAKGAKEHAKRIAERAKESHTKKRKHNSDSDSDDELEKGSKAARAGTESESVAEYSNSSTDSSVKERDEIAQDTQTLEKEQSAGKKLKASIRAQKETNKKRLSELFKTRNDYPSEVNIL
jgi:hypothetical protein